MKKDNYAIDILNWKCQQLEADIISCKSELKRCVKNEYVKEWSWEDLKIALKRITEIEEALILLED